MVQSCNCNMLNVPCKCSTSSSSPSDLIVMSLNYIIDEADSCLRYGELWHGFSFNEHVNYALYKIKRAQLLDEVGDSKNSRDDLLDALNSLRFAINIMDKNKPQFHYREDNTDG